MAPRRADRISVKELALTAVSEVIVSVYAVRSRWHIENEMSAY